MSNRETQTLASLQFDDAYTALKATINANDKTPQVIMGPPGCAKTSLAVKVFVDLGIPEDVVKNCIFRPSLRDPVDLVGLPHVERGDNGVLETHWAANSFIGYVNRVAEKYGIAPLIVDEVFDCVTMMQNALAGLMLDRRTGDNVLHDRVFIVATSNRVSDKSGANRPLTKLTNRCEVWEMRADLEAWSRYMLEQDADPVMVAYCRFDPGALDDFDPDRMVNGTMRSWDAASRIPTDLPEPIYLAKLSGRVPEARAAQYIAFRKLHELLPTDQEMTTNPMGAKLPVDNRGALYLAATLAFKRVTQKTWPALVKYVERIATEAFAPDIEAAFYKDVVAHKNEFLSTKEFTAWATTRGADVTLH